MILEKADALGNEIDTAKTEVFAPAMIRDGRFQVGSTEFAFTIAGGVARTPPMRLEAERATLTTTASADLQSMTVATDGALVFDPGLESVVGAEPRVDVTASGPFGDVGSKLSVGPLAQFLTQRALEREQVRVERMQSVLLEKQRLRRETRYFAALQTERERAEAERQRLERELRLKREEEEARRRAEEQAEAARRAAEAARAAEALQRQERRGPEGNVAPREVERAPLEAPEGANSPDAVSEFFRSKNLSPDRLRELLGTDGGVN